VELLPYLDHGLATAFDELLRGRVRSFRHAAFPFALRKGVKGVKPSKECRTFDRRKVILSSYFGQDYARSGGEIRTRELLHPKPVKRASENRQIL